MSDIDYDYVDYDPQEFTDVLAGYAAEHEGLPGQRLYYRTRCTNRMRLICRIIQQPGFVRLQFIEGDSTPARNDEFLYYDGGC